MSTSIDSSLPAFTLNKIFYHKSQVDDNNSTHYAAKNGKVGGIRTARLAKRSLAVGSANALSSLGGANTSIQTA